MAALFLAQVLLQPPEHKPWEAPEGTPETLIVESAREVWDLYESIGYTSIDMEEDGFTVPRIYLNCIVTTWAENESVSSKKSLFYRTMLPLVLRVNEVITAEKKHLSSLTEQFQQNQRLGRNDRTWLKGLAERYRLLNKKDTLKLSDSFFDRLSLRVDTIPVSLALGQMAYESAYATSRFAGEGNALFGQWCWGSGMLPEEQRQEKGDYRIARFKSPLDSVKAYARNINTHLAYKKFRLARANQRHQGNNELNGFSLAATLDRYSEQRQAYVKTLQHIITKNDLTRFDRARLAQSRPVILVPKFKN